MYTNVLAALCIIAKYRSNPNIHQSQMDKQKGVYSQKEYYSALKRMKYWQRL